MAATVKIVEEETEGVKARTVLWYMTFFGFAVNYVIRINANITVVDMIDLNYKRNLSENQTTVITSECLVSDIITNATGEDEFSMATIENDKNSRYISIERRILDYFEIEYERNGFKWDEHKQGMFLGSFYWLHFASQIPGGILASKYGTKVIYGLSNYVSCVLCFITPIVAYMDFRLLVLVRVISGIFTGLSWPAMHHLVGLWIPGNERGRFVTAYLGSSIGTAIAYPIFGYIIKISSWEWVFHFCFVLGTIWYIMWQYLVFDSPENHPRIDPKEKGYILQVLGSSVIRNDDKKSREVPWKAILMSRCAWTATMAQIGGIWGLFTFLTQSPTYFRIIHGWSIEMVGILSGVPHLMRTVFSFLFSSFSDWLLTTNKMSRDRVRKFATFFHLVLNGVFCFGLAYSGCNIVMALTFLTISLSLHGAVSSGVLAGMIDNSPNYSGVLLGITSTISICSGFVSPMVVGYMTFENQTLEAWQHIYELNAIIMIVCGVIYIAFNDGSLQPWNKPKEKKKVDEIDLRKQLLSMNYENLRRDSLPQ